MDDSDEDQRLPHHREPKEFVSLKQLEGENLFAICSSTRPLICQFIEFLNRKFDKFSELGVLSWRLDADAYETDPELKKIREDRGYSYMVCQTDLYNLFVCLILH